MHGTAGKVSISGFPPLLTLKSDRETKDLRDDLRTESEAIGWHMSPGMCFERQEAIHIGVGCLYLRLDFRPTPRLICVPVKWSVSVMPVRWFFFNQTSFRPFP
jgi:hypothetical protein